MRALLAALFGFVIYLSARYHWNSLLDATLYIFTLESYYFRYFLKCRILFGFRVFGHTFDY